MKIFHQCTCGAQISAEWNSAAESFFNSTFDQMVSTWRAEHKECIVAPRKLAEQQKVIDKLVRAPEKK